MPSSQSFMRGADETWIMHYRKSLPGILWMLQWRFRHIKIAEAGKKTSWEVSAELRDFSGGRVGIEPKTTLKTRKLLILLNRESHQKHRIRPTGTRLSE